MTLMSARHARSTPRGLVHVETQQIDNGAVRRSFEGLLRLTFC